MPKNDDIDKEFRVLNKLLEHKTGELHVIYNVSAIIGSTLNKDEVFGKLWPFLKKTLGLSSMSVYSTVDSGDCLSLVCSSRPKQDKTAFHFGEGAPGLAAMNAKPLLIEDASAFDGFLQFPGETRSARSSLIAVPLKSNEKVIGVLAIERKGRKFKNDDMDLAAMIAMLVSIGLQKCMFFEKTEYLSLRDSLTGLFNRRAFMERLDEEIKRVGRSKRPLSLIMMDIDRFKRVNDTYGHKEGDTLLSEMAATIAAQGRGSPVDILARYGGEEFTLLLTETGLEQAVAVAERVRNAVYDGQFGITIRHEGERPTISLGVATLCVGKSCESDFINDADIAMYHSKNSGRNRTSYMKDGRLHMAAAPAGG